MNITESLARALTVDELAQRLMDVHSDEVVRMFARRIADGELPVSAQLQIQRIEEDGCRIDDELHELKRDIERAIDDTSEDEEYDELVVALKELL